jgi:hypothetical protein
MERSFIIKTVATVVYNNWVGVTDEQIAEYKANNPEYANDTDEEIVQLMYYDGELDIDDSDPIDWQDEQVVSISEYKY